MNNLRYSLLVCVAVLCSACISLSAPQSFAETRGFVVSHFHVATYHSEKNCPDGDNGDYGDVKATAFRLHGYSKERIAKIVSGEIPPFGTEMRTITTTRGRKDGKPVSIYHYPTSAPDPKLKQVVGPYAYGFNLDGKGPEAANAFEDPETGDKGVDNQLYRVLGCNKGYNVNLPVRPYWEVSVWNSLAEKMPAWLFTITTEKFGEDGKAEVNFYQAINHRRKNVVGDLLFNATYIVSPDPRYHGKMRGEIKDGVFVSEPGGVDIMLAGDPDHFYGPKFELSRAQIRLNLNKDGTATGYLGGYQPWRDYWFSAGLLSEANSLNMVGLWYGLSQQADARPDSVTGKNRDISGTYRIESVPAFVAYQDGELITFAN